MLDTLTTPASPLCRDPAMLNEWHVVAYSTDLVPGQVYSTRLLERDLVGWRDAAGEAHIWDDLCIHRGARLSKGWIADDTLVCPYHGWRYNGAAECVLIPVAPGQPIPPKARAFPGGAARARLRLVVRMTAPDEVILAWLGGAARHPRAIAPN